MCELSLFNCLSNAKAQSANFPFCTIEPNVGVITVPDDRLVELSKIDNPAKVVPTTIEIVDIAGLVKGASKGEGLGNKFLGNILNLVGGFAPNWQVQHNTLHHGFTNIDGYDEDIDPGNVLRLSPSKPRFRIHRYQHIYAWFLYGLMTFTWVLDKDFKQLNRYRKE